MIWKLIATGVLLLVFSGCMQLQVEVFQTLKRTGHVDLTIMFISESPDILNTVRKSIDINPGIKSKYHRQDTTKSVAYVFRNIDPLKDKLFAAQSSATSSPLLNKDTYSVIQKTHFPYNYFTYVIDLSKSKGSQLSIPGVTMAGLTVGVFGKITTTNGYKIDEHHVKFNIALNEKKKYVVTFKELCWVSLFCQLFHVS